MKKSRISGAALAAILLVAAASVPHAAPLADAFTLTVYEQSGTINAYTFLSSDPLLYAQRPGYPGPSEWGGSGYDFGTAGAEFYDLFFSDSLGNLLALSPGDELPAIAYLRIVCMDLNGNDGSITPAPTWVGAGNNIDAVKISCGGKDYWANAVLQATYGLCDEPFSAKTSNFADAALGPQDAVITKMGCGPSALTLRFSPVPPPPAPPAITSITDVGNDQGGKVRIRWNAALADSLDSVQPVTAYAIWRRIDPLPLAMPGFASSGVSGDAMFMYPPGEWDYVTSVPACCEKTYSTLVPTLADSTIVHGMYYSVFYVRALTATPGDYLDSPVDSGYSVDNLAPAQPVGMAGMQVASGLKIMWAPSTDPDFSHFVLARGASENDPAPDVLSTLAGTSYIDETWTPQSNTFYYMLSAVDRSGNIGACSRLAPDENVATLLESFHAESGGLPRRARVAAVLVRREYGICRLARGGPRRDVRGSADGRLDPGRARFCLRRRRMRAGHVVPLSCRMYEWRDDNDALRDGADYDARDAACASSEQPEPVQSLDDDTLLPAREDAGRARRL